MYQTSQGIATCRYTRTPKTQIFRKHDAFDITLQLCENPGRYFVQPISVHLWKFGESLI
mgnify:CR=1 FL=1